MVDEDHLLVKFHGVPLDVADAGVLEDLEGLTGFPVFPKLRGEPLQSLEFEHRGGRVIRLNLSGLGFESFRDSPAGSVAWEGNLEGGSEGTGEGAPGPGSSTFDAQTSYVEGVVENELVFLPSSIGQLDALELLDLGDNNLSTLPASLRALGCLKVLRLNKNKFVDLPGWL
ncbi:MAG: hypothetical protein ACTSU5_11575, partial [Promethearchaeota archaeon]